ncbi:MAG TPA: hypothetical protein PLO69_14580 [Gammaproteobacteria bacterium]|nr:hypothetical protein [Gammaproteobacteria bacterium]
MDAGEARYIGSVCIKHPESKGARYTANSRCVKCGRKSVGKYAASLKGKATISAYRKKDENKRWRKAYRKRDRVRESDRAYKQTAQAKERAHKKNNSPERKIYMATYRTQPEQKAKRALRSRLFEQHVSKHATPPWANRFYIGEAYDLAKWRTKATGVRWEVDHIVPLVSKVVCGLHVENNIRVVPHFINREKSNKLIPALIG